MTSDEVAAFDGKIATLYFKDGSRHLGRILSIDPEVRENEVFYKLLVNLGPRSAGLPGTAIACSASELDRIWTAR